MAEKSNDPTCIKQEEAMLAHIALALQEPDIVGQCACPSDEELASLAEGTLAGERRKILLSHLDNCPECYEHWLATTASIRKE